MDKTLTKTDITSYWSEAKSDPKDRIQVEVGDSKQSDFKPQVKIMRWDNEVNFSMRAQEHADATFIEEDGIIKYKTPDYEVHQYSLEKSEGREDGGFEFEWVLYEKPETNILTTTIQTKGLDFFYQPELTQEEIEEGCFRPENVVGSYAVYHSTKGRLNENFGKDYKVGKAFNIYRPKAIDSIGQKTWCDLNIEKDTLVVTIPQKFIETAIYPIIIDPTFGYTTIGGTSSASSMNLNDRTNMASASLPVNGTVTDVNFYGSTDTSTTSIVLSVYSDTGATYPNTIAGTVSSTQTLTTTAGWKVGTVSYSLTAGTYWTTAHINNFTGNESYFYDVGTGNRCTAAIAGFFDSPPATFPSSQTIATGRMMSTYATYTASGGSTLNKLTLLGVS